MIAILIAFLFGFVCLGVGVSCVHWDNRDQGKIAHGLNMTALVLILLCQAVAILGYGLIIRPFSRIFGMIEVF